MPVYLLQTFKLTRACWGNRGTQHNTPSGRPNFQFGKLGFPWPVCRDQRDVIGNMHPRRTYTSIPCIGTALESRLPPARKTWKCKFRSKWLRSERWWARRQLYILSVVTSQPHHCDRLGIMSTFTDYAPKLGGEDYAEVVMDDSDGQLSRCQYFPHWRGRSGRTAMRFEWIHANPSCQDLLSH